MGSAPSKKLEEYGKAGTLTHKRSPNNSANTSPRGGDESRHQRSQVDEETIETMFTSSHRSSTKHMRNKSNGKIKYEPNPYMRDIDGAQPSLIGTASRYQPRHPYLRMMSVNSTVSGASNTDVQPQLYTTGTLYTSEIYDACKRKGKKLKKSESSSQIDRAIVEELLTAPKHKHDHSSNTHHSSGSNQVPQLGNMASIKKSKKSKHKRKKLPKIKKRNTPRMNIHGLHDIVQSEHQKTIGENTHKSAAVSRPAKLLRSSTSQDSLDGRPSRQGFLARIMPKKKKSPPKRSTRTQKLPPVDKVLRSSTMSQIPRLASVERVSSPGTYNNSPTLFGGSALLSPSTSSKKTWYTAKQFFKQLHDSLLDVTCTEAEIKELLLDATTLTLFKTHVSFMDTAGNERPLSPVLVSAAVEQEQRDITMGRAPTPPSARRLRTPPSIIGFVNEFEDENDFLHLAARRGMMDIIFILLRVYGLNINGKDIGQNTGIHFAARQGHATLVAQLMHNGAAVNVKNQNGCTPLHLATEASDATETIIKLLRNGAYVNEQNNWLSTPLHFAVQHNHSKVVATLIRYNANVNAKDKWGESPLHIASKKNYSLIVKQLLAAGCDVNSVDREGKTPLHEAMNNNARNIVYLLLRAGADMSIPDRAGFTPNCYPNPRKELRTRKHAEYIFWYRVFMKSRITVEDEMLNQFERIQFDEPSEVAAWDEPKRPSRSKLHTPTQFDRKDLSIKDFLRGLEDSDNPHPLGKDYEVFDYEFRIDTPGSRIDTPGSAHERPGSGFAFPPLSVDPELIAMEQEVDELLLEFPPCKQPQAQQQQRALICVHTEGLSSPTIGSQESFAAQEYDEIYLEEFGAST